MSPREAIQRVAIEVLGKSSEGLPYRELVAEVAKRLPDVERSEFPSALGDLPKDQSEAVWRPRPGHFKLRADGEGPAHYARGRKRRIPQENSSGPLWPDKPLPNHLDNLIRFGFHEVGAWQLSAEGIDCHFDSEVDAKTSLLAYVMGENVVFIGRARTTAAGVGYVRRSIRSALTRAKPVRIFALTAWDHAEHKGLRVNVAAGIEDELVERMQPPWNNFPGQ